jgi:hypothetical protein
VNFQDLRFAQLPSLFSRLRGGDEKASKPLGAGVRLDGDMNVIGDVYGSGPNRVTVPAP